MAGVTWLIPDALIVALSPMAVLPPVLLLLYSDRPRSTGLTYLCGWLAGMAAVISAVVLVSPVGRSHAAATSSRLQLGIGVVLIALGVVTWLRRRHYAQATGWLTRLQTASPLVTGVTGLVFAVANPKFILACLAGGVAIDALLTAPAEKAGAIGFFVVLAGSTTAAPIIAHLVAARYADKALERMRHWVQEHTAAITAVTLTAVGTLLVGVASIPTAAADQVANRYPVVLQRFDHDPAAFTEGLFTDGATLYESTGLEGQSALRELDADTGQLRRAVPLPPAYFGEGIADAGAHLWQLTYDNGVAIEWDKATLSMLREVPLNGQGWGLCRAGERLIRSDGSAVLHFHALDDMHEAGTMAVTYNGSPVSGLNSLDCAGNRIWANVFPTDQIVGIDIATGAVQTVVYATALRDAAWPSETGVLNGIAHLGGANGNGQFLVTGKNWPAMYRVRFDPA
jgi:glutamine cyclotransferase